MFMACPINSAKAFSREMAHRVKENKALRCLSIAGAMGLALSLL
jgi:hypothetical protein